MMGADSPARSGATRPAGTGRIGSLAAPEPRYEIKYAITEPEAAWITRYIEPYCRPDPRIPAGASSYTVTSLYLDSAGLDFYWQKKTLQERRLKVRGRMYGPEPGGIVFVEVKRRVGDLILKSRVPVHPDDWVRLLRADRSLLRPPRSASEALRIEDFRNLVLCRDLRPVLAIRYERTPFIGRMESYSRLTFDRAIGWQRAGGPSFPAGECGYRAMDFGVVLGCRGSPVLLEVKFSGRLPLWVEQMIRRLGLERQSFSKYVTAVDLMLSEGFLYRPDRLRSVVVGAHG